MSITVPLEGFGGGSNPLNFKVVGNPMPSNPKENTIWVNTDVKITGWVFSAAEPETFADGVVWFLTGAFGSARFNALKKHGIQLCPLSAKQYVGGSLVDKEAQIYKDGAWSSFVTYLFDNGNQCTALTGGWSSTHQNADEWNYDGNYSSSPDYGGGAWVGETLRVGICSNTGMRLGVAAVGTRDKIDLTPYRKIKAVCNLVVTNPCYVRLAINTTLKTPQGFPTDYVEIPAGTSTVELDVSNISGLYHVILGGINKNSESLYGCDLTVSSVILE